MAPSAVNNVIRQQMADHRAQWNDAEWFDYGDGEGSATVTYVAADQFKVEGVDVSTAYHVGRRVRVVGSGTGTIYGTINAVVFSIDTTVTVTFDTGSMSNESLTVSLGIISAQNEASIVLLCRCTSNTETLPVISTTRRSSQLLQSSKLARPDSVATGCTPTLASRSLTGTRSPRR